MRMMDKVNAIVQLADGTIKSPTIIKYVHLHKKGVMTGRMPMGSRLVPVKHINNNIWEVQHG